MKILIAGSRSITEYDLKGLINESVDLIICGGAKGVDSLAEKVADELGISKLVMRPEYKKYGRAAPLLRNNRMVEIADEVIVIWDGISKGAKYTAELAKNKNKKVTLIDLSDS
jgi:hypothetical protein